MLPSSCSFAYSTRGLDKAHDPHFKTAQKAKSLLLQTLTNTSLSVCLRPFQASLTCPVALLRPSSVQGPEFHLRSRSHQEGIDTPSLWEWMPPQNPLWLPVWPVQGGPACREQAGWGRPILPTSQPLAIVSSKLEQTSGLGLDDSPTRIGKYPSAQPPPLWPRHPARRLLEALGSFGRKPSSFAARERLEEQEAWAVFLLSTVWPLMAHAWYLRHMLSGLGLLPALELVRRGDWPALGFLVQPFAWASWPAWRSSSSPAPFPVNKGLWWGGNCLPAIWASCLSLDLSEGGRSHRLHHLTGSCLSLKLGSCSVWLRGLERAGQWLSCQLIP